jgi:hypothetical protein
MGVKILLIKYRALNFSPLVINQMEASRVPYDHQHRFVTIDASPSLRSRFIVRWKPLLLPINVSIEPELVQRHDVSSTLMLDGL